MRADSTGVQTRLAALHDREVLTTLSEPQFDELSRLASRVCEAPFSGITVVGDAGTWLNHEAEGRQEMTEDTFCTQAVAAEDEVMVVPDARKDPRFAENPLVINPPWIRFYAAALLIMPEGKKAGVLWVADRTAREPTTFQTASLRTLARQVVTLVALRRANAMLGQRESELRSIIDTSGEAIYGVDTLGRCTFVNPACLRMLGFPTPEELLGREMHDVIHYAHANGSPYPKGECTILEAFREGRPIRLEDEVFWRADGSPIWVIYTSSPLRREGHLLGAVINFVDVTEQRRTREELAAGARVRERFAGVLGHDLRNPLSTVLMGAQLIARSGETEVTRTVATRVVHAAERMQRLIRDLLDFIRVREGGALALTLCPTNLAEIVREIVGELELSNPERRIELAVSGDATGEWDPDRIAQVCSNLLSNAIQHGDAQLPVRIRIESEGDDAIVTVENGGPPIPDELRPYLFDPFRRGQPAGDGSKTGLGLGLFIVHQVALAHGGDVSVRSDRKGTVFTVRLPRDRA